MGHSAVHDGCNVSMDPEYRKLSARPFAWGAVIVEERGYISRNRQRLLTNELEPLCHEIYLVGQGARGDDHLKGVAQLDDIFSQSVRKDKPGIIIPESSYAFSARLTENLDFPEGNKILAVPSLLAGLSAPSGFLIVGPKALGADAEKNLSQAMASSRTFVPANHLTRMIWQRMLEVSRFPRIVKLELTSRCNLRCKMCLFHGEMYRAYAPPYVPASQAGDMNITLFEEAIDECAAWQQRLPFEVMIFGANRGEALLHPQFMRALHYVKGQGLGFYLTTNGTVLDEKLSGQLLDAGINQINVSIDGLDRDVVSRIRLGSEKYDVSENIKNLLKLRNSVPSKKTIIALCLTKQPENEGMIEAFVAEWIDQVDVVMIQTNNIYDPQRKAKVYDYKFATIAKQNRQLCPAVFGIDVEWDGNTWLCPAACQTEEVLLGRLQDSPIYAMYNSEKARRIRAGQIDFQMLEGISCVECDVWESYYTAEIVETSSYVCNVTPGGKTYYPKQ